MAAEKCEKPFTNFIRCGKILWSEVKDMRIDKLISESGIASRKEAARVARSGGVLVDGVAV